MKIVLFGRNGQLGRELQRVLAPFGEVVAVDYQELDLQDASRAPQWRHSFVCINRKPS